MHRPPTRPGVYIEEVPGGPRVIEGVATSVTAFVGRAARGPVDSPTRIHAFVDYGRVFGGLRDDFPMSGAVHQYFANGGREAVIVRVVEPSASSPGADGAGLDAVLIGERAERTGMYALEDADIFNLLCLPPRSPTADVAPATYAAAASYCEERRAMLLIDPPASAREPVAVIRYVETLPVTHGRNAAIYFPRVRFANPLTGGVEAFAPSGAVAGVIARTDADRGVWKAPAGRAATLVGAVGLDHALTRSEQGDLNRRGINGLRTFPGRGTVIWGARTLAGADTLASEWKYIAVRRLALFIEASIHAGTDWAVFEPNAEPLWSRLRHAVSDFLHRLFRQGAFQGSTPGEAYFVRCGRDTTSPEDIERGVIDVVVGFAPLRPAEFVVLRIRRKTEADTRD